jgi:short-subunit dehydrogenase
VSPVTIKRSHRTALAYGALAVGGLLLLQKGGRLARRLSWSFRGKTALITGGSRGLGLLIAQELERRGCNVVLVARDQDELARAALRFADATRVLTVAADVCSHSDLHEAIRAARTRFGGIDVLVNNAGVIDVGPLEAMKIEDYEHAMDVHFWAPLRLVREVVPEMRRRGGGRIVNISSIGGVVSVPHLSPYAASKFALTGFSQGITAELAGDGIRVTTVIPGLMRTASPRHGRFKGQHQHEFAWFSIADALPILSINARTAARAIVRAAHEGRAHLILTLPARLSAIAQGLAPAFVARALAIVNRLLPGPGGIGSMALPGYKSMSKASPSWLTTLSDGKAGEYNER